MEFEAVFFSREELRLTPGDLGRFQLQRLRSRASPFQPLVLTIGALENSLLAELPQPEIEDLPHRFLLYDLAGPLLEQLRPPRAEAADEVRMRAALARDLGDGLERLKLAGLTWDQVAALPPSGLTRLLAEQGRRHDAFLKARGRLDRAARRRRLLEDLSAGRAFKTLAGVRRIVYRQVRRLSPFETEFLLALATQVRVEVVLKVPSWVREEKTSPGAGFDLLRSIRRLEGSPAPGLDLEFAEPEAEPSPPALAYAADVLLSSDAGRLKIPPPDPAGQIQIVRTPTTYHEVEEAARRLKKLLAEGKAPEGLALVVPSLSDYGPLVEDLGRRFGLAFHFRRGRTLDGEGPARAILDLAEVWGSHWERARILALVRSPYFQGLDGLVNADGLALAAGVTDQRAGGGFEENLAKLIRLDRDEERVRSARVLLAFVNRLKQAGQSLAGARDWPEFFLVFKGLLAELGWPGSKAPDPALAEAEEAAARAVGEELARLESALARPPAPSVDLDQFRLWLKTVLAERHVPDGRSPDGRIWVLNYYDLHGGLFEEIFFLGLNERVFPQAGPDNMWWPREFVSAAAGRDFLGRSLWSDAAERYRQEELLLAAGLGQARERVWLFHHTEDQGGRPSLPSPLLTALKDLWPAGDGGTLLEEEVTTWRAAPDPAEAAGPDELWVGLARLNPADWPATIPRDPLNLGRWAALRRRREAWRELREARPGPAAVARWLKARPGHQGAPLLKPSFLAGFAECPLAFWFGEALGLSSYGAPLEEWPPGSEGESLHRILEAFFRRRLGPDNSPGPLWPGTAREEACLAELLDLAAAEGERAVRRPVGRLPLWRLRQENLPAILAGWLKRELAPGRSEEETRPWFVEWSFGPGPGDAAPPWPLIVEDLETIYFHGRVDRIDRTSRGLTVRDYKRRDSNGLNMKPGQAPPARSWPLLIYALAAGAHFGLPTDCAFEIMDSSEGEARRPGLPSGHPALDPDPAARAKLAKEGALSFPGLLAETWGRVKAGAFRPEGENCDYCLFSRLCPRVDGEAAREEPA